MNKQEFLSASLPYELKCQYEGIIYYKNEVNEDPIFGKEIIPVEQKTGNKIGILKEVHVYKKFWTAKSGRKSLGLKTFYNGDGLTPIIRNITDLTKECVQSDYNNGKPFIPIVELANIEKLLEPITYEDMIDLSCDVRGAVAKDRFKHQWLIYSINDGFSLWHKPHNETEHRPTLLDHQFKLYQMLLKWHFWPNMNSNEEVIYVNNKFNPYI